MANPAIEIERLTKDYPVGFWRKKMRRSLDHLSLQVEEGESFGFLGPNGAGKTTTMKLLMGLIFPTSGTARVRGRSINDVRMHREIGYMPEQPYFYDYLTAAGLQGPTFSCGNFQKAGCSAGASRRRFCTIRRWCFWTSQCLAWIQWAGAKCATLFWI